MVLKYLHYIDRAQTAAVHSFLLFLAPGQDQPTVAIDQFFQGIKIGTYFKIDLFVTEMLG